MKPERHRQIGEIYHAALELDSGARAAFIERACAGDQELRSEVESLLSSHEQASGFLASPALGVAAAMLTDEPTDALNGKTIGRYRILSIIGVGGMGRVYLAQDTELGRRVAVKLLPEHFTHDKNQLQRFRQEAHAASSLNHPNILTVHEIGRVDDRQFIATEYVEGETLRDRLTRPIGLRGALDVAAQVADALAAAHDAGIIHRDIKPENVMIRRDGYVKVLDFGIAKLTEKLNPSESATSATTAIKTNPGAVLGTAAYMSPEQARGLTVDARTDIWSLGVVLYEMIAGQRPFIGPTHSDTIVSILEREPAPIANHVPEVPPELQRVVSKSLAKNSVDRYQTAQEIGLDLKRLRRRLETEDELGSSSHDARDDYRSGERLHATERGQSVTQIGQAPPPTSSLEFAVTEIKRHKAGVALAGVLFVAAIVGAVVGLYRFFGRRQSARPAVPLKVTPLTIMPGIERSPAFSPDGKQVAFVSATERGNFDLYVKLVGAGEPLRLTTNPAKEMSPAWSPDGRYIAFLRGNGEGKGYYLIPALGGAERKLSDAHGWESIGVLNQVVAWSPDGRTLALMDKAAENEPWCIYLLSIETGERRKFTTPPAPTDGDSTMAFSPDGRTLAFVRSHNLVQDASYLTPGDIYLAPVAGGDPVRLTFRETEIFGLAWTPDGAELVFSAERGNTNRSTLWRINAAGGTPATDMGLVDGIFDVSISNQGNHLAFTQVSGDFNIYRAEVTPEPGGRRKMGPPTSLIYSTRSESDPRLSPDGKRVVFISNRSGDSNMWVCDADGKNPAQLTDGIFVDTPAWSPDGHVIAFNSRAEGNADISAVSADGGAVRRLTSDPSAETLPSWSPDGTWLYFSSNRTGRAEVWKMPAAGGAALQLTHDGGFNPVVSPDARTVYYLRGEYQPWLWSVSTEGGAETRVIEANPEPGKWIDLTNWAVVRTGIYFLEGKLGVGYTLKFFDFETRRTTSLTTFGGPANPFAMLGLTVASDERSIVYAQRDRLDIDLMLVENFH